MSIQFVPLKDIATLDKKRFSGDEAPYIGMEDIESGTGRFLGDQEPKSVGSSTFAFSEEHLLYGRLRPYLNKVLCPGFGGHCSSEIFPFIPHDCVDRRYLYYWFIKPDTVEKINATCTGARMPRANMNDVVKFEVPLPPLDEQKRIVQILDSTFASIDKTIENTENNLANARELFESYLNSLDFPKRALGELVSIMTGKLNANAAVKGGKYPFFTCSREASQIDDYAFDREAILLAGNNASGDFNVKHYAGKFNAYQRTYVITINDTAEMNYRFLYFQLLKALKELKDSSVGAGTKFLKLGMIKDLMIQFPSLEEQSTCVETLDNLLNKNDAVRKLYGQKLDSLTELKQSILQKAFTGQLTADFNKDEEVA